MFRERDASDDDRRWAQAEALLGNPRPETVLAGLRRRRRKMWLLLGAVMAGLVVAGFLVGLLVDSGADDASDPGSSSGPLWLQIVGLTCTVAGTLIIVTYLVKGRRAGLFGLGPLSVLRRPQVRSLRRQVLGKEPVEPERLPLLRYLAGRMTMQAMMLLLPVGLTLGQLGGLLLSPSLWRAVFVVALALLFLAAGIHIGQAGQQAELFLAGHPEQPETAAAPTG